MNYISRSEFLKICGGLLLLLPHSDRRPDRLLLSFSTLGCPDWSLEECIDFAASHQYDGVEIRGLQRQLDLPLSKYFNSPAAVRQTKKQFQDKGILLAGLGSSCELHHRDTVQRKKNLDEARRFTDLAAELDCPCIRVFPNNFPESLDRRETMDLMSQGLNELGNYAKGTAVKILMETHGDLVHSDDIEMVMGSVDNKNTGLVWDVANMWSVTKEPPSLMYPKLKKYIFHTHIKDLRLKNRKEEYTFVGRGEVPIFEAIDLLARDHYKGYFSFEWEKLWHPEIEAPELALADYPLAMKHHAGMFINSIPNH